MTWTSGIVLVLIALLAGVGITTVGPGGVFLTAALFGITSLSSAAVAGTASATFVATGLVGAGTYVWSGELATRASWEAALALSGAGAVGALTGTLLNLQASDQLFGDLLGAFLVSTAGLVVYREYVSGRTDGIPGSSVPGSSVPGSSVPGSSSSLRRGILTAVGGGVGVLSGLLGVGGPVIAVPTLVSFGMPMLRAVAVAQVQSVFLALFAAVGYGAAGAIDFSLALLVGVPQLFGVVIGWGVAHRVSPSRLRIALAVVLAVAGTVVAL
ncbi:sulfite exporter TauE/SafE family protein [Salinibacter grassmerensis]|uniref:sulfite exporter TauE/SafE family protein n=1 Tax=Salinibacter grassmerensis TaxID=3040353 RepID=UPI0021E7D200|nr:sulfite exporter TauE/SafE family protein [Salinibacter grassmerensis]